MALWTSLKHKYIFLSKANNCVQPEIFCSNRNFIVGFKNINTNINFSDKNVYGAIKRAIINY
jgi:hypothetical protein